MANPWLKKNPFLSMWLSGVNAVAGSVRGRATRAARRQAKTTSNIATKAMFDAWTRPWTAKASRKKKPAGR